VRAQDVKEPSAWKNSNKNSKNDDREAGTGFSCHKVQIKKLRGLATMEQIKVQCEGTKGKQEHNRWGGPAN
jgi:hypothetical protein